MTNKDTTPIDMLSLLEQFEGSMVNFAPIVASYYGALIKNNIPPDLAAKLTIEWHNLFWAMHFNLGKK